MIEYPRLKQCPIEDANDAKDADADGVPSVDLATAKLLVNKGGP